MAFERRIGKIFTEVFRPYGKNVKICDALREKRGDFCTLANPENRVPLWEKYILTIQEAAEYFHIGEKKLRRLAEEKADADFILVNGNRVMIKRKLFEKYLDEIASV